MNPKPLIYLTALFAGLLAAQITKAQGVITYLNNTSHPVAGTNAVGGPNGMQFQTGTNNAGYALNNIQIRFADAKGNPDPAGLGILLLADNSGGPGALISLLIPNANPTHAGLYTCVPSPSTVFASASDYWILVVSIAGSLNDAYELTYTDTLAATTSDGWFFRGNTGIGQAGIPIFAINATPVPEPSSMVLLTIVGLTLLFCGRPHQHKNDPNLPLSSPDAPL